VTRPRLELGKEGEDLALKGSRKPRLQVHCANYRCLSWELDLVARTGRRLVSSRSDRKENPSTMPNEPCMRESSGRSPKWRWLT